MEDLDRKIISAVRRGESRRSVAVRLGASRWRVDGVCVREFGKVREGVVGRKLNVARCRELHDSGCNDSEIARQLGVAKSTVARWRTWEANLPSPSPVSYSRACGAVDLVRNGLTFAEAARKIGNGVTRNAVAGAVWRAKKKEMRGAVSRG